MSTPDQAPVPFVDLGLQHRRIEAEVLPAIASVMSRTAFIFGPDVEKFEQEFAEYSGVRHCIGVANGTDAVELALRGAGIGAGDEVIIPANTFVATAEAVLRAGASVVLADCDEDYLLDPAAVAARTTERTRAVVAVHLYGQMAPMKAIADAAGPDVLLIEDAAQSQGAAQGGRPSGSFGVAAGTSFYPGKNLGAYGDAGAVLTDSDEVADLVKKVRNHGGVAKYEHAVLGVNSRLDGIQAAVLSIKLARLDEWNAERAAAAARYEELLAGLPGLVRPRAVPGNEHVWHLYVVRVPERDRVLASLQEQKIGAGIHYPAPVHRLPAFSGVVDDGPGSHPVAERTGAEILSLPMFPGITEGQQERVADALRRALG